MSHRVVPIADFRRPTLKPRRPDAEQHVPTGLLTDTRGRPLRDLRISVTDRCNFRCIYCMPRDVFDKDYPFAPHSALLTFEELTRLTRIFVAHGVEKIRLTGGEPLLRKGLEQLVSMLAELRTPNGGELDITLTTNGSLLARKAQTLKDAGLKRVTVSLDALDEAIFQRMNDADFPVRDVLEGIEAAERAGLSPVKINMVVKRGVNDQEIVPMARYFRQAGQVLRFIEYMDVGNSNGWCLDDVVPSAEVIARIQAHHPLVPIEANYPGEVAQRWRYTDGKAELGVISSVTQAFCHSCSRARLSTEGRLFTCLFSSEGTDLRAALRDGSADATLSDLIAAVWTNRTDRYSEIRSEHTEGLKKVEMSYIGG